jgi:hypothetical protein
LYNRAAFWLTGWEAERKMNHLPCRNREVSGIQKIVQAAYPVRLAVVIVLSPACEEDS